MKELSLLAKLIVECKDVYNGHNQIALNAQLKLSEVEELVDELLVYYEDGDSYISVDLHSDGSGGINLKNRDNGDKMLFSWGKE